MDVVRETCGLLEPYLCRKEVMASVVHEGGAYTGQDHSGLTRGWEMSSSWGEVLACGYPFYFYCFLMLFDLPIFVPLHTPATHTG